MIIYGARGLAAREQAHTLLARAAGLHWGLPSLPTIGRRQWGKPYFPARPELEFNLSHSGPFALCALDSAPVGVDIQTVRPRRPALLRRVCAPEELAWLEGRGDLWSAFALLWALKESRVKESGRGLTSPISAISIPLPAEGPVQLDGLWFRNYKGEGWAGSVCGHSPPPDAIIWLEM